MLGCAIFYLSNTTLSNAQINFKANITIGGNNSTPTNLAITHGIASGDVTNHSVTIWSRSNKNAVMNVWYDTNPKMTNPQISQHHAFVNKSTDFAGHIKLENLKSDSVYYYKVQFSDPKNTSILSQPSAIGSFHTAPDSSSTSMSKSVVISFVVGGDLGGQNYCRRSELSGGYPIFAVIKALSPDFFIFNGDQIYADYNCTASGPTNVTGWHNIPGNYSSVTDNSVNWNDPSQVQRSFDAHWEYNRADPFLKSLLQNTSMYSQADDHEVLNNYGGPWKYYNEAYKNRTGYSNVVNGGINAFFAFSPIGNSNNTHAKPTIYRSFNWGKDLDLFILDAHSYRSRNDLPDSSVNKTLFGKEQLKWLEQGLLNSKATWKIISDDDPISIPECDENESLHTPRGCDNWATDGKSQLSFTRERGDFMKFLDDNNIKNVLFVTTDVHFPANIVINEDPNHDGKRLILYELVSGPLTAGPADIPNKLDPTINATYLYSEGKIFTFGHYTLKQSSSDGRVHFIADVRGIDDLVRPGSHLDLRPR